MTAREGYRCVGCKRVTMWTYVATGEPRCENCAVWSFSPEDYNDDGNSTGIDWPVTEGQGCAFINLNAVKGYNNCRGWGQEATAQKVADVPFVKVSTFYPYWAPSDGEDECPWIHWTFWVLRLYPDGVMRWDGLTGPPIS
ncbi:hypothetical protein DL770_007901 [Monosporascus sp. CRB-9-2]|nr:hypothetical protein DL770_007901 [Monosporascus sp. CRB-9-2]